MNSVLNAVVTSDLTGDPEFVGVTDTTAAISQVTFSLTDAGGKSDRGHFRGG